MLFRGIKVEIFLYRGVETVQNRRHLNGAPRPPRVLTIVNSHPALHNDTAIMPSLTDIRKGGWHPESRHGGKESFTKDMKGVGTVVIFETHEQSGWTWTNVGNDSQNGWVGSKRRTLEKKPRTTCRCPCHH